MNWNIMKHAVAVMKWIEKHEMKYELKWNEMNWKTWNEACSISNEMNWKHEMKYELKWNELKWIEKHEMKHAVAVMKWIEILWSMQ